jgi:hypothetical protein
VLCSLVEVDRRFRCYNTSETLAYFNETTRHYIPEGCHLHTCSSENLKSHIINTSFPANGVQHAVMFLVMRVFLSDQDWSLTRVSTTSSVVPPQQPQWTFWTHVRFTGMSNYRVNGVWRSAQPRVLKGCLLSDWWIRRLTSDASCKLKSERTS